MLALRFPKYLFTSVLLSIFILGLSTTIHAQAVTNYQFSASSGTFTEIRGTGGAVSPLSENGSLDDGYYNNIPIGFTFRYVGTEYTTVSATTNGWLTLGQTITDGGLNNDLAFHTTRPIIAPLWDDMLLPSAATGNFTYKLTGSAPNRVLTLEWRMVRWDYQATTARISFQVKLYETTNAVQFVYRRDGVSNPTNGSGGASIGIAASDTDSGSFLSLNGAGTNPTVSSTVETNNILTRPATGQVYTFTPPLAISGTIKDSNNAGISGITVNMTGTSNASATTDANGNYSFNVALNGSYTITPQCASAIISPCSPTSSTFNNITSAQTANFTATRNAYTISGHISDGGNNLSGVTVILSGDGNDSTVTDANGNYSFANLTAGFNYTVTPSLTGIPFAPASYTFNILSANQTANFSIPDGTSNYQFNASSGTFTQIKGTGGAVSPPITMGDSIDAIYNNLPIGFTFSYMGADYTTVSASNKGWITTGQPLDDPYFNVLYYNNSLTYNGKRPVIAPFWDDCRLASGLNFSYKTEGTAPNRVFTVEWLNVRCSYQNPTPSISYQAKLYETTNVIQFVYRQETGDIISDGASIGITSTTSGEGSFLSLSDSGATPSVSSINETSNITTKPATGQTYTFTPSTAYIPRISGFIKDENNNPIQGITVNLTGDSTASATTNAGGFYRFFVPLNGNYTVTPQTSAVFASYSPMNASIANITSDQLRNFAATRANYSISGRVTTNLNVGLSGVTVNLSGNVTNSTTTDANGNYSFTNLTAGYSYSVVPSASPFMFAPVGINYLDGNQTNVNFNGSFCSPAPASLSGLAAWYRAENDAGDSSGNNNNGNAAGPITYPTGINGNAFSFDGSPSVIAIPRSVQDDFSIMFWIKTIQTSGVAGQWYEGIGLVDGEVNGVNDDFGVSLGGGKILFGTGNPDVTIQSPNPVNDGQWHHVAATRDKASGELRLYIDGVDVANATGGTQSLAAPANLNIGTLLTFFTGYFNGQLDEIQIYNRALLAAEIQASFNASTNICSEGNISTAGPQTNVNVSLIPNRLSVLFAETMLEGNTVATPYNSSGQLPAPPAGYNFFSPFQAYDIRTSAGYTGNITVTINVPNVSNASLCNNLRIGHYDNSAWTISGNTAPSYNQDALTCTLSIITTHLSPFAVLQNAAPTAASVAVSGRVLTPDGRGLTNALVNLTDSNGNSRTAMTGSFGYYLFEDVEAGQMYIITVSSKRYRFASQFVNVVEDMSDLNFIAAP